MQSLKTRENLKGTRRPARLPDSLNRRLSDYAITAAATGVAAMACSLPAEAAPVCKNLTVKISSTATFALNPAHQIAPPFNIAQTTFSYITSTEDIPFWWNRGFFAANSAGAKVLLGDKDLPADLAAGDEIGPGGQFGKGRSYGLMFTYGKGSYLYRGNGTVKKHRGNVALQQPSFVGFQFAQAGKVHYGWARLQVTVKHSQHHQPQTKVTILGYGFETAPNTAIGAGSCGATEASEDSQGDRAVTSQRESHGPTLGDLAAGVLSMPSTQE